MKVYKQLSIFLENEPGTLERVLAIFKQNRINIIANSIENAIDWAVYRCVVSDPVGAVHLLGEGNTFVLEADVLGLTVDDTPGSLASIAGKLAAGGINIDYAYGSSPVGDGAKALLILKPSNLDRATQALSQ